MFAGNIKLAEALGFRDHKIDMHSHILPGFDDGSRNIEETISLSRDIKDGGTDIVIWTPHLNHPRYGNISPESILSHFNKHKEAIEASSGLRLICGSEVYFSPGIKNALLTLGETNYVLVEFDYNNEPLYLKETLYDMQLSGYEIIFAHVERYKWLVKEKRGLFRKKFDLSLAEDLKNRNIFFQINYSHLCRMESGSAACKMLDSNMVEFIGSDKHRIDDCRKVINWFDLEKK